MLAAILAIQLLMFAYVVLKMSDYNTLGSILDRRTKFICDWLNEVVSAKYNADDADRRIYIPRSVYSQMKQDDKMKQHFSLTTDPNFEPPIELLFNRPIEIVDEHSIQ